MRKALYLPGAGHKNPIPAASVVGNILCSGIVFGQDQSGALGVGLTEQVNLMFDNMLRIVEHAGGSSGDIVKVTLWMQDRSNRVPVNERWLAIFPDKNDMPARMAMQADLDGGKLIQCDFMAVLGRQQEANA